MSTTPPERKRDRWDVVGTRIGVIAGAVGLLAAVVGLPQTLRDALGQSSSPPPELTALREQARAAGPRLDVRYLLLTTDLMQSSWSSGDLTTAEIKETLLRPAPILWNDVAPRAETLVRDERNCGYEEMPHTSVAFLEISNRGRRDAVNVVVEADRLTLPKPVRIREAAVDGDDYNARLRADASSSERETFEVSRPLGPGDAVRLPLFVSDAPADRYDRWCALPGRVYLPLTVRFDDPERLVATTRIKVRRMRTPLVIAPGAFERG